MCDLYVFVMTVLCVVFLGMMRIPLRSWLLLIFTSVTSRRMLSAAVTLTTRSMRSWNVPRQIRYVQVDAGVCIWGSDGWLDSKSDSCLPLRAWVAHSSSSKCPLLSFCSFVLLAGRFHPAGWRFVPREQTVAPMPPQLHHYAETVLHGRLAHSLQHSQWPDCQLQHYPVSSAVFVWPFLQNIVFLLSECYINVVIYVL